MYAMYVMYVMYIIYVIYVTHTHVITCMNLEGTQDGRPWDALRSIYWPCHGSSYLPVHPPYFPTGQAEVVEKKTAKKEDK